jgi:predicted DNA-binding transcriptional regulator YafY
VGEPGKEDGMRRADRLFDILQSLRGGRLVTARVLAQRLEVSERTIYRDMADLQASGVPIDGEAGVGYLLRAGFDLPPLMFSEDEIEAVAFGLRMAAAWGGERMAASANEALVKVEAVLPERLAGRLTETRLYAVPGLVMSDEDRRRLDVIHEAINARRRLAIVYANVTGEQTQRLIRPLGLYYWGRVWTLAAWCELRTAFRTFRPDRFVETAVELPFPRERGRELSDYLKTTLTDH